MEPASPGPPPSAPPPDIGDDELPDTESSGNPPLDPPDDFESPSSPSEEEEPGGAMEPASPGPPPSAPPPDMGDDEFPEERELGAKMTFLEHLDELRKRLLHAVVAVAVTFCFAWFFREPVFEFLAEPIKGAVDKLVVIKPTEAFTIYLKVSFLCSIFVAAPYLLFQLWLFIAPGLYRKEKGYVLPFLSASTILFLLGGMFAYYIILPVALDFLINEFGKKFEPMISAVEFFKFESIIILGMGVIFQMPVLVAFLSIFGILTPRFLWKNFRYAFLLIMIIAAVVSPTADALNLFFWAVPMVLLYLISICVSWVFKRRRDRALED